MVDVSLLPMYLAVAGLWILQWLVMPERDRPRGAYALVYIALGAYAIWVFSLTFGPFRFVFGAEHFRANLVPLQATWDMIRFGYVQYSAYNVLGNLAILAPFAVAGPIIYRNMRHWASVVVSIFMLSLSIETVQLIFGVRLFDVDDLILNTLGGLLGYLIARRWILPFAAGNRGALVTWKSFGVLFLTIVAALGVSFLFALLAQ